MYCCSSLIRSRRIESYVRDFLSEDGWGEGGRRGGGNKALYIHNYIHTYMYIHACYMYMHMHA